MRALVVVFTAAAVASAAAATLQWPSVSADLSVILLAVFTGAAIYYAAALRRGHARASRISPPA